ncbi:MAG: hypothetical protein L0228_12700 [Planctomycetes bacterium]|nr:hypothetical protein [Planctomycetota bacterium]
MVRSHKFAILVLPLILSGCDRSLYEVAPVNGMVTVDDKPLYQGGIMFSPIANGDNASSGKAAVGKIRSDGTFRLSTFEDNDGAIVGEHWVTIVNHDEEDLPDGVPAFARIQVPDKKTVVAGTQNQIDIKLSRDQVRKYREDDR